MTEINAKKNVIISEIIHHSLDAFQFQNAWQTQNAIKYISIRVSMQINKFFRRKMNKKVWYSFCFQIEINPKTLLTHSWAPILFSKTQKFVYVRNFDN